MIKFLTQLFCRHNWTTDEEGNDKYYNEGMENAKAEGADTVAFAFKFECSKCGKTKWIGSGLESVY